MAKKQKAAAAGPNAHVVPSREVHQRLNYLLQASQFLASLNVTSSSSKIGRGAQFTHDDDRFIPTAPLASTSFPVTNPHHDSRRASNRVAEEAKDARSLSTQSACEESFLLKNEAVTSAVSRTLVRTMTDVAKKGTVKMDPSVKRLFCKGCNTALVPGVTASTRVRPSGPHAHMVVTSCLTCGTKQSMPAPPLLPEEEGRPEASTGEEQPAAKRRKVDKRARKPVFFERKDHVTFAGNDGMRVTRE